MSSSSGPGGRVVCPSCRGQAWSLPSREVEEKGNHVLVPCERCQGLGEVDRASEKRPGQNADDNL